MADSSFLPVLPPADIERAFQTVSRMYEPGQSAEDIKLRQQELYEIQLMPQAWGLVLPMLNHADASIQFFGAHTIQVKIARDWLSFPEEHYVALRDLLIQLTAHSLGASHSKVTVRKLFIALSSLALKLVPLKDSKWPNWIVSIVETFSRAGIPAGPILDFLAIVAEEVASADLVGPSKSNMRQTLKDSTGLVIRAVTSTIDRKVSTASEQDVESALKCFQTWLQFFGSSEISDVLPLLYVLLDPDNDTFFVAASNTIQELLDSSPFSDSTQMLSGTGNLTKPLMVWLETKGNRVLENTLQSGNVDDVSHSTCKLLAALGDHSTVYFCEKIASRDVIVLLPKYADVLPPVQLTESHLVQNFLRVMLAYTGLPGYFGEDEETSDMTNTFWYMFQETLWDAPWMQGGGSQSMDGDPNAVVKAVYVELVKTLQRKCTFPPLGHGWLKDQTEKFTVYRRDIGDTLINAYYVIREDMLGYFVDSVIQDLAARQPNDGWENIESTLHCIASIQEAIDYDKAGHLAVLFSPETISRLPSTGFERIRITALNLLGAYTSWFSESKGDHTPKLTMLMAAVGYAVAALPEPALSIQAALALRDLCDANRKLLAPQINAFGELHAGLARVPDTERNKVLQSIASVIEALPPSEQIAPIEAMATPIVQKLMEILTNPSMLPPDARNLIVLHLETLAGIAKGLTRMTDDLLDLDDDVKVQLLLHELNIARSDERMERLRSAILAAISRSVEVVGQDASVGQAINELVKSITSLPSDITVISLPATPLLGLVCSALQRQITASWLVLATMLFAQMKPAQPFPLTGEQTGDKKRREAEIRAEYLQQLGQAKVVVREALSAFLSITLPFLNASPSSMAENPDIVQEFFNCLDRIAIDFVELFYELPDTVINVLVQCTLRALSLQERYSLSAACTFQAKFIQRSFMTPELEAPRQRYVGNFGRDMMRAIISGLAGESPRSTTPNLVHLLGQLLSRCPSEAQGWLKDIVFDVDFIPSKAGPGNKERFVQAIMGTRQIKKIQEAAEQFSLVARGLDGTAFGYATARA